MLIIRTRTVHFLLHCVRGARIVASLTLLAIPDAPPRCFAHRARSASVPPNAAKDEPPSMFFEHRRSRCSAYGKISPNEKPALLSGSSFGGAYWTRKRSEGKKMNNDGYMVLSAGEIDKVLGLW